VVAAADSNLEPTHVQENARHCLPSKTKYQFAITQTVKGVPPQDVQTTNEVVAGSPCGIFPMFPYIFSIF
jgi:hypothetical protein